MSRQISSSSSRIRISTVDVIRAVLLTAELWAELRSKGNTKIGAAVYHLPSGQMFFGYNGFPRGVEDTEERWSTASKHFFLVHAEENAILKAVAAIGLDLGACDLICTMLPCSGCLRKIASCKIKKVYYSDSHADMLKSEDATLRQQLIEEAGISIERIPREL